MATTLGIFSATHKSVTVPLGRDKKSPDHTKNQSDCRIGYPALWEKKIMLVTEATSSHQFYKSCVKEGWAAAENDSQFKCNEYWNNFSPSTLRALDEGLCDIRARPCKRTIVFGDYFLSSENLTCHVRESKVASMLHILIVLFHSVGTLERERILISYAERTTVKIYLWSS